MTSPLQPMPGSANGRGMTDRKRTTVSKEMVRLRLYVLCLAGDMAGLFCAFLAANWFVLGALWGEPGKPHGLVMFAMIAPLYALLGIKGGAYGIATIERVRRGISRALWPPRTPASSSGLCHRRRCRSSAALSG